MKTGTLDALTHGSETWEAAVTTAGADWLTSFLTQLEPRRSNPVTLKLDRFRAPSLRHETKKGRIMGMNTCELKRSIARKRHLVRSHKEDIPNTKHKNTNPGILPIQSFVHPGDWSPVIILMGQTSKPTTKVVSRHKI